MSKTDKDPVSKADPLESRFQPGGFFNLTSVGKEKVKKKRRRKGMPDQKPKKITTSTQLAVGLTSAVLSKSLLLPLDRLKIGLQVHHLSTYAKNNKPSGALSLLGSKVNEFNF